MDWGDEFGEAVRAEGSLQARGRDRRWGRDSIGSESLTWEGVFAHTPAMAVADQRCEGRALDCGQWGKVIMRCRKVPGVVMPPGGCGAGNQARRSR